MSFKQSLIEAKDVARLQWKPFAATVAVVIVLYAGSVLVEPGMTTYLLSLPAAAIIAVTALARVNDIGPERMTWRWHLRRISLVLAGAGAVMVLGAPFTDTGLAVTWRGLVILWGVAGAWLTTPFQPPWEDYISGKYRLPRADGSKPDHLREFAGRVTGRYRVSELRGNEAEFRRGDGDGP